MLIPPPETHREHIAEQLRTIKSEHDRVVYMLKCANTELSYMNLLLDQLYNDLSKSKSKN